MQDLWADLRGAPPRIPGGCAARVREPARPAGPTPRPAAGTRALLESGSPHRVRAGASTGVTASATSTASRLRNGTAGRTATVANRCRHKIRRPAFGVHKAKSGRHLILRLVPGSPSRCSSPGYSGQLAPAECIGGGLDIDRQASQTLRLRHDCES
jgi:hypothetical protein